MVPNALFLEGPVKPFNVSVVVRTVQPRMSGLYTSPVHLLLKVTPVLWAVVGLDHGEREAEGLSCFKHGSGSYARQDPSRNLGVREAGIQINDRVVIQSPPGRWVNVVDGVCMDKLARPGDVRSPRVIPADSWLPGAVKAVVAAENPPHTAE